MLIIGQKNRLVGFALETRRVFEEVKQDSCMQETRSNDQHFGVAIDIIVARAHTMWEEAWLLLQTILVDCKLMSFG